MPCARPSPPAPPSTGFDPEKAANIFAGTNISGIVLEVPDAALGAGHIGFWGVTALATDSGGWRQVNRCAQPLINTILHPADSELADEYNTNQPREDRQRHGPRMVELVSNVVAAMGTADDPTAHAERVRDTLFPDILRYQVGTAASYSFAGRNGRGLVERSPEVIFATVLNTAVTLGLGSDSAAGTPRSEFPYLPLPVVADPPR